MGGTYWNQDTIEEGLEEDRGKAENQSKTQVMRNVFGRGFSNCASDEPAVNTVAAAVRFTESFLHLLWCTQWTCYLIIQKKQLLISFTHEHFDVM